jgi:hypothetical protein
MGWRLEEVWLDSDLSWFGERKPRLAVAGPAFAGDGLLGPVATGLQASRQRRLAKEAERRRRRLTRTVPAVALVVGSATMLPIAALRNGGGQAARPLQEDPPSLTFRFDRPLAAILEAPVPRKRASPEPAARKLAHVEWRRATSVGLPYSGQLVDGTQLPVEGPNWVTWNPVTDSVPNLPRRLYGNERTIRTIIAVAAAYREAHPQAPPLVVGDISFAGGGVMDEHVSHQNGLDVDVYYPRRDRRLQAPTTTGQIDRSLAQDLLDRFVAAGAQVVFVGYSTGLGSAGGVAVPYPNHENHMHVRFPSPG